MAQGFPKAIFVTSQSVSTFTGMQTTVMVYSRRPELDLMRTWITENRRFNVRHRDSGVQGKACRADADCVSVDIRGDGRRELWYWTDCDSVSVESEVHLSTTMRDYVKKWAGKPNRHLPIITSGGNSGNVNMSHVGIFEDTLQIFYDDLQGMRKYCGHDFVIQEVDLELHQLCMVQCHAEEWEKHTNPFKKGDAVTGPGVDLGVVVSVYPQEIDGTKYYDMDVVTGDFDLPTPVHSYQFTAYQPSK